MRFRLPPPSSCLVETQAGPSGPVPPTPAEFLQWGSRPSLGQDMEQSRCPKTFTEWENVDKGPGLKSVSRGGEQRRACGMGRWKMREAGGRGISRETRGGGSGSTKGWVVMLRKRAAHEAELMVWGQNLGAPKVSQPGCGPLFPFLPCLYLYLSISLLLAIVSLSLPCLSQEAASSSRTRRTPTPHLPPIPPGLSNAQQEQPVSPSMSKSHWTVPGLSATPP